MPTRLLLVMAAVLLAAACAPKKPFDPGSTTMLWRELPVNRAALRLDGPLRAMVLAVSDRRGGQTLDQRYVLRNNTRVEGENSLLLKIIANGKATRITSDQFLAAVTVPVGSLDAKSIHEGQNRYGSFLYVSARPEGSPACLFALQRLQRSLGAALPKDIDQADITLRVCDATASPDDLLPLMSGWSIDPALGDPMSGLASAD
jgi:hypothetical protein